MKIFIICSKAFYDRIPEIQSILESDGHEIVLPNSYGNPGVEQKAWDDGEHADIKGALMMMGVSKIKSVDAVLCLNFEKHGIKNYIGGATFLELYEAFKESKKIYLFNPIPEGILYDEIDGFKPLIINGNLDLIK